MSLIILMATMYDKVIHITQEVEEVSINLNPNLPSHCFQMNM